MTGHHQQPADDQVAFLDEEGDRAISPVTLDLWRVCLIAQKQFGCAEIIFEYSGPSYPQQSDEYIDFFVPRHHSRSDEIVAFLIAELEPIRRSLVERSRSVEGWRPATYASVRKYSGIAGALAFDTAFRAALENVTEGDVAVEGVRSAVKEAEAAGAEAARAIHTRKN